MSQEQDIKEESMIMELAKLKEENAKLKAAATSKDIVSCRVGQKGGCSVYGLGNRFPVTLYKEQWMKLLEKSEEIKDFIKQHDSELKGPKET